MSQSFTHGWERHALRQEKRGILVSKSVYREFRELQTGDPSFKGVEDNALVEVGCAIRNKYHIVNYFPFYVLAPLVNFVHNRLQQIRGDRKLPFSSFRFRLRYYPVSINSVDRTPERYQPVLLIDITPSETNGVGDTAASGEDKPENEAVLLIHDVFKEAALFLARPDRLCTAMIDTKNNSETRITVDPLPSHTNREDASQDSVRLAWRAFEHTFF